MATSSVLLVALVLMSCVAAYELVLLGAALVSRPDHIARTAFRAAFAEGVRRATIFFILLNLPMLAIGIATSRWSCKPAMPITEETTMAELELELTRLGATIRPAALTDDTRQWYVGVNIPPNHRIAVLASADGVATLGTGPTFATAIQDSLVHLRAMLQRKLQNKPLPHVTLEGPNGEILS